MIPQMVGMAVGVALMAAPAVLGYAGSRPSDLHRVVGPTAASLALIAAWEATRTVRWPNTVLGAVLVLAPLVVAHSSGAALVGVVSGVVLAAATPFRGRRSDRYGGGWSALVDGPVET